MICAEIRSGFVGGQVPAGPAVDLHLRECAHCRELFANGARLGAALGQSSTEAIEPGELLARVSADIERDVGARAKLRSLPTRARASLLLIAVVVLLAGSQLLLGPREDVGVYSAPWFWLLAAALCVAIAIGTLRLSRGLTAPLSASARDGQAALALLLVPAVVALLAPLGAPEAARIDDAWGSSSLACFSYGAVLVAPLLMLGWLVERRDGVSLAVVVAAGALAGVAANLLLFAHCSSAHLGHLMLGHASIGVAWALALAVFSGKLSPRA